MTDPIQTLIDAGNYREAALASEQAGQLAQAQDLFERLFDYARAGQLAEQQGDHLKSLSLCLRGNLIQEAELIRRRLMAELSSDIPHAMTLFEQRGYYLQAAELAESIGQLAGAAKLYAQSSAHFKAACLLERIGQLREAGEAFETHLRGSPDHPDANLGLGRILQRFGRHREVIPLFSKALNHPRTLDEAGRRIAFAFFKLQLVEAGRSALELVGLPRHTDPQAFILPFEHELLAQQPLKHQPLDSALDGRYRLEQPLGGRFAASFAAHDLLTNARVTLRFLPGSSHDNVVFFDDIERLHASHIPGNVRFLEINRDANFFVLEHNESTSLLSILSSPLPPTALQCRAFSLTALKTVSAAHQRGIIHGSLTPGSLSIAPGGICLIDDWGLHRLEKRMETQTGGPESPFVYRAPELNLGRDVDFRADLFSIAAILFRCLQGKPPSLETSASDWDDWPEGFPAFFDTALHSEPELRFPSADFFRRALLSLPWGQVAQRRLPPTTPTQHNPQLKNNALRFPIPEHLSEAQLINTEDSLLNREVQLLKIPTPENRSPHLSDRLHTLGRPASHVFQDILLFDELRHFIVLERLRGSLVTELKPSNMISDAHSLRIASPLLIALATAHRDNIGLGTISPDTAFFDGMILRVPLAGAILMDEADNGDAQRRDSLGFWNILATLLGFPNTDTPNQLLYDLQSLEMLSHRQMARLASSAPDTNTLANVTAWFENLSLAVDTHLGRRRVFERLEGLTPASLGPDFALLKNRMLGRTPTT